MKILHITDSHGTVKGPESRKDIYYITFLRKLYELGYKKIKRKLTYSVNGVSIDTKVRYSEYLPIKQVL